jgi:hypothetical protein
MSYEFYDWIIFNDIRTREIKKDVELFSTSFFIFKLALDLRTTNQNS